MDFYQHVPKELEANLEYRLKIRRRAQSDEKYRRALLTACREDFLFFLNAFGFLYEPRIIVENGVRKPNVIPFITWPHQDKAIRTIIEHLGVEDIGLEKARGEGASWIACYLADWDWLFHPMSAIGLVSKSEDSVDNPDDPDSLFWKIDWSLSKLPNWMVPRFKRNVEKHTLKNLDNKSTITGYAATEDVASGGRKKWFLKDELAKFPRGPDEKAMTSTQAVTNCRLIVSTPKGSEGAYYDLMHEPSSLVKIILDWKDNPTRNRGLYEVRDGKFVALDPSNPLPPNYEETSKDLMSRLRKRGYKIEGTIRSPWYDHECDRPKATPQTIAQEYDRDYGGSMYRIFPNEFTVEADKTTRPALTRGTVTYHPETLAPEFQTGDDGPVHLWTPLDARGKPPLRQYVLGADLSSGLGGRYTSNSVAQVIDLVTMEQVLEFAINTMQQTDFADTCMAIGKLFYDAYLIWETNYGGAFTNRVREKKYPNIYYRTSLWKGGKGKKTKEVGWHTDERTQGAMFGELLRSVRSGELKIHSADCVRETVQWVHLAGKIQHIVAARTKDDASRGKSHGDRVVALAVALQGVRDRPAISGSLKEQLTQEAPAYSMAARQKDFDDSRRAAEHIWDDRENWDLARGRQHAFSK